MTIRNKILIPVIVLTILVIVAMSAFNITQFSGYVNRSMESSIRTALAGAANMIEDMKPLVSTASLYIAEDPEVIEALKNGDNGSLLDRATKLQYLASIDMCTITDTSGTVIARVHAPDIKGDSLADNASVKSALSGTPLLYVEEGTVARLLVGAATPIYDNQGNIIGALLAGYRLDTETFVDSVKKMYGCEASVVLGGERVSTTILNEDHSRAIGSKIAEDVSRTVMEGNTYVNHWEVFNRGAFFGAAPISDVNGQIAGILLVGLYADGATETVEAFIITICVIILFMLATYILIVTLITNRIVTPINGMIKAAHRMLPESIDVEVQSRTKDEVKNLTYAFNSMVENTRTRMIEDDRRLLMMSALINSAPQYIAYVNAEGQFSFFNEAICDLSGYTSDELKVGGIFMLYSDDTNNRIREEILPNIFTRGKYDFEIPLVRKDGEIRVMSFSGFKLEDDEYACGTIASDITEKKELENALIEAKEVAEASNRAKSQFLANMSHEIRTPMNTVISMTELLLEEKLTERQRVYLTDIKSSGANLLSIINDILDFSKIESGMFEISPVHFDFYMLLESINSIFEYIINEKKLSFIPHARETLPQYLYGDDVRIRQIITNLLANAVKFTHEGSISMDTWADEQTIYFDVSDTGIGIKEEDMDKLFDSFLQLDAAANRQKAGTGLGLPIVKNLIEMMGGSITVESEYGAGSVFHVAIPRVDGDPDKIARHAQSKAAAFRAPDAAVLVVDDYEPNLRVAKGLLGLSGIDCDTAPDGETAIDMISHGQYDIVFMDHMMPGMDGVETTRHIREMGYDNSKLPIIALTANAVNGVKEMLIQNGMDDFLSKPIDRTLFADILAKWLPSEKVYYADAETLAEMENAALPESSDCELMKLREAGALDVEWGLALLSGAQQVYLDALRGLCNRIPKAVSDMDSYLAGRDAEQFAIDIHGVKSSLATAGARAMSKEAADMEAHAKAKDIAFCQDKFPDFGERLLLLHKVLYSILFPSDEGSPQEPLNPVDAAQKLLSCIERFDDITALDILSGMENYDCGAEGLELTRTLKRQIELFEYDDAKKNADRLLEYFCDRRRLHEL